MFILYWLTFLDFLVYVGEMFWPEMCSIIPEGAGTNTNGDCG